MTYSEKIKTLRVVMLISQTELADLLEVSYVAVNRWENGKYEPTIKVKRKLNELFEKYKIERYDGYIVINKNRI